MIPLFRPSVSKAEIASVTAVLKSGWWGMGLQTEEFERQFAAYVGAPYAVGVNSATAALHLALAAHGITGGEVIIPALTFVSTGLAPLYNGAKVVFADIDEKTLCIDWTDVKRKLTPLTRAIIPVWYGGHYKPPALHLPPWVTLIEDAAHAAGTNGPGKQNTACWSFHAVKNLATGDGGMVTTHDYEVYKKLLTLRWCGIDKSTWERAQKRYGWDYAITTLGFKSHMNDLTASLGLVQLARLKEMNNKRRVLVKRYLEELADVPFLELPFWEDNRSWHLFVVRVEARDRFIDHMLANGVSAGVHYKPITSYPMFPNTTLPVTDRVWKTLVTLPLYPDLTQKDFKHIIKTIKSFV